jgi:hypothetical protein
LNSDASESATRRGRVEQPVALRQRDELEQALVELVDDEAVEGEVALEQPHERRARHQRDLGLAQRHPVVSARRALDDRPLAEPRARPDCDE